MTESLSGMTDPNKAYSLGVVWYIYRESVSHRLQLDAKNLPHRDFETPATARRALGGATSAVQAHLATAAPHAPCPMSVITS